MSKQLILFLCITLVFFCTSVKAEVQEEDRILVELSLGQNSISDSFSVFSYPRGILIPIGEFSLAIGLALNTDAEKGIVEGFILHEDRHFKLDLNKKEVWLKERPLDFNQALIAVYGDEILIDSTLLERWFPLEIKYDSYGACIHLYTKESFPLEERLRRERQNRTNPNEDGDTHFPTQRVPYEMFSAPYIDQTLSCSLSPNAELNAEYTSLAAGDFLYFDGNLYLKGSKQNPFSEYRLSLGRKDPDGTLLGFLQGRRLAIGSLDMPGMSLISNPNQAVGFALNNLPLSVQNQVDSHSFRGELPPGWDVEIYQNDILVGYQPSRNDGRYEFDNLPLLSGINEFRLVFYGPQGQRRQEIQRYNIEDSLAKPQEVRYQVATGLTSEGRSKSVVQCDLGLTKQLACNVGYSDMPLVNTQKSYETVGLRGFWNEYFFHTDLAYSNNGGSIFEGVVQANYGNFGIDLRQAFLNGFTSELFPERADPILNRTLCSFKLTRPLGQTTPLYATMDLSRCLTESGMSINQYSNRLATTINGFSLAHRLDWNFQQRVFSLPAFSKGGLQVNYRRIEYGLRGELNYTPQGFDSLLYGMEMHPWQGSQLEFDLAHSLTSHQTQLSANLNWNTGKELWGVFTTLQEMNFTFGMTVSFSLIPDSKGNQWHQNALPTSDSAAASVNVYLDANQDGRFNGDDQPLSGVEIAAPGIGSEKTDEKGQVFFPRIPAFQPTDFTMFADSLPDPMWTPCQLGIRLIPRPNTTAQIDFPVIQTSELLGNIQIYQHGALRQGSGIALELVDQQDRVIQKTRSAFDGFYTFSGIPKGKYRVRISPDNARQEMVVGTKEIEVAPSKSYDSLNFITEPIATKMPTAKLKGAVYLKTSNDLAPAEGVEIELCDTVIHSVQKVKTSPGGGFSLSHVKEGNYTLRLSNPKYRIIYPHIKNLVIKEGDCYDKVNILVERKK